MDFYRALYEICKTLQKERDTSVLPRLLLDRVIDFTGAEKGFIVVKEEGSFQEKYHVHFDRDVISSRKRKFSRTLVREAISAAKIIYSEDITSDPRFVGSESIVMLGAGSALVTPVEHNGQVEAVIYLEKRERAFSDEDQGFMAEFSHLAGIALHQALERQALTRLRRLHQQDFLDAYNFKGLIARDPRMIHLLETVVQVAASNATVLINGETGTGKELIARAVWQNSDRANQPYVTLHCGALPETLFESELFGHRKGSFTGAHQDRNGRIAGADGGTLFLDEVAEIPMASQAKLLRFIQFGEYQRVGSDRVERVDLRIIVATHKDLGKMVEDGTFRQDLYFRLNVLELEIPPLRERKGDIPILVAHFLEKFRKNGEKLPKITPEAMASLERYHYPGNVRELAHVVERICVMGRGSELGEDLLPRAMRRDRRKKKREKPVYQDFSFDTYSNEELKKARNVATKSAVAKVEQVYLQGLMELCEGNVTRAAEVAGMQRPYLHRLLARYREG